MADYDRIGLSVGRHLSLCPLDGSEGYPHHPLINGQEKVKETGANGLRKPRRTLPGAAAAVSRQGFDRLNLNIGGVRIVTFPLIFADSCFLGRCVRPPCRNRSISVPEAWY